jgi:diguanylate cyclase (GGDEF)-like protein
VSTHPPSRGQFPWYTVFRTGLRAGLLTGSGISVLAATIATLSSRRQIRALHLLLGQARTEARLDPLTALPNRRAALSHLAAEPVGMVGLLDLDQFKQVDDRHGHHVGDQLLITVADRLTTTLAGKRLVARLSGDEFLLLWSHTPSNPIQHATAVLRRATDPITLEGHTLHPTASLGLALPGPHLSGTGLLAAADHAMYEAKHRGSGVHLYTGPYPPAPLDRRTTGRRNPRHTPPDATNPATSEGQPR